MSIATLEPNQTTDYDSTTLALSQPPVLLTRMETHQMKKTPQLRALRSW
jgi:hypothetical protein